MPSILVDFSSIAIDSPILSCQSRNFVRNLSNSSHIDKDELGSPVDDYDSDSYHYDELGDDSDDVGDDSYHYDELGRDQDELDSDSYH